MHTRDTAKQLVNLRQKGRCLRLLFSRQMMVPGVGPRKRADSRERQDSFLVYGDVEPSLPPPLRRVDWLQGEVARVAAHLDPAATNRIGAVASVVRPDEEDRLPQRPTRGNPQEAFAQNHKTGNVQYAIRGEIVDLHPISVQKTTNEVVERKSKPLGKNSAKHTRSLPRGLGSTSFGDGARTES